MGWWYAYLSSTSQHSLSLLDECVQGATDTTANDKWTGHGILCTVVAHDQRGKLDIARLVAYDAPPHK